MIEYGDFECPFCAALSARLAPRDGLSHVFRHFPVRSSHPRAWAAACAAGAAARQGGVGGMAHTGVGDTGGAGDPPPGAPARARGGDGGR
ncbi:MAG: DsbA family protein, partial [Solirubrobacteraceae bacterium]